MIPTFFVLVAVGVVFGYKHIKLIVENRNLKDRVRLLEEHILDYQIKGQQRGDVFDLR